MIQLKLGSCECCQVRLLCVFLDEVESRVPKCLITDSLREFNDCSCNGRHCGRQGQGALKIFEPVDYILTRSLGRGQQIRIET